MASKHTQTAQVSTIGDKSVDDPIVTVNNGTDDTEVVLQCTICSETLEYSSLLDRHIESVHGSSSSESSCPDCNLEFTNNLELSDHMNSMHAQNALTSTDRVMQPTSASSGPASTAISRPATSSKSGSATAAASETL